MVLVRALSQPDVRGLTPRDSLVKSEVASDSELPLRWPYHFSYVDLVEIVKRASK